MKKVLLIIGAFFLTASLFAQSNIVLPSSQMIKKGTIYSEASLPFMPFKPIQITSTKSQVTTELIGSSINMYTIASQNTRSLTYNSDLNLVMFTHRAGGPLGGSGNNVYCKTKVYNTTVWDTLFFITPDIANRKYRYPGGAISNPIGNTDLANAYAVITGPSTDAGGWANNYFNSQKLNKTSIDNKGVEMPGDSVNFNNTSLSAFSNGMVCLMGGMSNAAQDLKYYYFQKGQIQADTIAWNPIYKFNNLWRHREFSNGHPIWAFNESIAFSNDGLTGYAYAIGYDTLDDMTITGAHPIVWKTTDAGATWTKQPLLDLSTLSSYLQDYIYPVASNQNVYRPAIMCGGTTEETSSPATVDADGNLHILCYIQGMASNNPDSLLYVYLNQPRSIFDLYTTTSGWAVKYIDTLASKVAETTGYGDRTYDHYLRIGKSDDGNVIHYMWTDTPLDMDETNIVPDVYGQACNLSNNTSTPTKKFTQDGIYFYMNVSDFSRDSAGSYFIPVTYAQLGLTPDDPIQHHYLNNIVFEASEFVGINEVSNNIINSVNVYPNPSSSYVNINLSLSQNEKVQVIITNIMGQNVFAKDYGKLMAGNTQLTVNTSNLSSGIYFVTVNAGNSKSTGKLVVK